MYLKSPGLVMKMKFWEGTAMDLKCRQNNTSEITHYKTYITNKNINFMKSIATASRAHHKHKTIVTTP